MKIHETDKILFENIYFLLKFVPTLKISKKKKE